MNVEIDLLQATLSATTAITRIQKILADGLQRAEKITPEQRLADIAEAAGEYGYRLVPKEESA